MIMSETKNNDSIYVRLGQVMQSIKAIGKNQKDLQQGFKFRGIDDFMNELHVRRDPFSVFVRVCLRRTRLFAI